MLGNMRYLARVSRGCTSPVVKSPGEKARSGASAFDQIYHLFRTPARGDDALDAAVHGLSHGVKLAKHAANGVRTFFLLR